ncbi:MAG: protein kinase [Planctomycetota bacterium]
MADISGLTPGNLVEQAIELPPEERSLFLQRIQQDRSDVFDIVASLVGFLEDHESEDSFLIPKRVDPAASQPPPPMGGRDAPAAGESVPPELQPTQLGEPPSPGGETPLPDSQAQTAENPREEELPTQGPPSTADTIPFGTGQAPSMLLAGDYEIRDMLGKGGQGAVYRAMRHSLKQEVALKVLKRGMLTSPDQIARFHREAQAAGSLDHPGIVRVYDVGEHNDVLYLAMAIVKGGSLSQFVGRKDRPPREPIEPKRAARIMAKVCRAVEHAHDHGLIHRDLKPANILLADDDEPKVTDFGLVKDQNDKHGMTQTDAVMGTPSYMPPEQARGEKATVRADIYSLGATLYALVTGRPPFTGENPFQVMEAVRNKAYEPLPESLHRDLRTVIEKSLHKAPTDRFRSAGDLAEDLENYAAGRPVSTRPLNSAERAIRWARRNPAIASAVASVAAVLVVATVVSLQFAFESRRQADKANGRSAELESLIDSIVKTSEGVLGKQPGTQAARNALLGDALEYYQKLVQGGDGSPRELADSQYRLGFIRASLGREPESEAAFKTAIDELTALDDFGGDDMLKVAGCYHQLAKLKQQRWRDPLVDSESGAKQGNLALWRSHADQCVSFRRQAVEAMPGSLDARRVLANALMSLGLLQVEQSADTSDTATLQAALETLAQAQEIRRELLKEPEPPQGAANDFALGEVALAKLADRGADLAQSTEKDLRERALAYRQKAANRLTKLPAKERDAKSRYQLAQLRLMLGDSYQRLMKIDDALQETEAARSVARTLVIRNPAVADYRIIAAKAERNLAVLYFDSYNEEAFESHARECVKLLADGLRADPANEDFLTNLVQNTKAITRALVEWNSAPLAAPVIQRATNVLTELTESEDDERLNADARQRLVQANASLKAVLDSIPSTTAASKPENAAAGDDAAPAESSIPADQP